MTNLTNALNLLNNYIDPESTPLETTPGPQHVFVLQAGLQYEPESWGVVGVYASQAAAEAAAATIIKSPFLSEIDPYPVEDVPLPPSDATQPIATSDDGWGAGKWCETYRGSGRLTGHTTDNPTRMADGSVVGFVWYENAEQFYADFLWQQHDHCHSHPQWDCPHCN